MSHHAIGTKSPITRYEVKIRTTRDRVMSNGKEVEGGRVISRHYDAKSQEQAEAKATAARLGKIISIREVKKSDLIGDLLRVKGIRDLIEKPRSIRELEMEAKYKNDPIVSDMSISDIIYNRNNGNESSNEPIKKTTKEKRARRLEFNKQHRIQAEI